MDNNFMKQEFKPEVQVRKKNKSKSKISFVDMENSQLNSMVTKKILQI